MLSLVALAAEVEAVKLESSWAREVWTEAGLSSFFAILMHNVYTLLTYPSPKSASSATSLVYSFANHSFFVFGKISFPFPLCLSCSLSAEFLPGCCILLGFKCNFVSFCFPFSRSCCSYFYKMLVHRHAYVIVPDFRSSWFCTRIVYGLSYTNSNWDSSVWGGKNSYETILPDMYSTGQAQLASVFPSYSPINFIIS